MKTNPILLGTFVLLCNAAFSQTDSAEHYYRKGIDEKNAKRYLVALNHFNKAIQFDAKFKQAYIENAFTSLEMRKTDNAIAMFSKVIELEPNNAIATKELMDLYYNYRQFAKAKEMANKCNNCPYAEKIRAMCFYQEEDYAQAVSGLTVYLAKHPADAEASYTLARSYLDMEDYKNAVPAYRQAITLDITKNMWAYELGMLYYTMENYKDAVTAFKTAAENGYPQKSDFKENLGWAYMYAGQAEEGEQLLLSIATKKTNNKEMLREMSIALYQGKQYQKALGYCQRLMEMDGNDGKALYQAGLCFQKMGNKDKGQAMCDKAIEMDPSLNSLRQKQMTMGL